LLESPGDVSALLTSPRFAHSFNFAPTQFQNLLNLAGHNLGDPSTPCDDSVPCVLPFAGESQPKLVQRRKARLIFLLIGNPERNVASIVLVCNGISFALQVVLFLVIGSFADFGRWRPWILIGFTALSVGISIGWLGVEDASKWEVATGLYIVGRELSSFPLRRISLDRADSHSLLQSSPTKDPSPSGRLPSLNSLATCPRCTNLKQS
jgi:hypothetical protein